MTGFFIFIGECSDFLGQFAAQAIQFADGDDDLAFELVFEFAKLEIGFAEAAELRTQGFVGQGAFLSKLQRHLRFDRSCDVGALRVDPQFFSGPAGDDDVEVAPGLGQFAGPAFAQFAVQLGIVGLPEKVTELDHVEIQFPVFEGKPHGAVLQR